MYLASLLAQTSHFDNVIAFLFEHNLVWRQGCRLVNHVRYVFDIDRVSSAECTYRSAERRIDTRYGKIIIALLNTLRQLLSHIHYYYPHTITIRILSRVRAHAHAL